MNDILFWLLILLICIRLIGLFISIDFFLETKRKVFKNFSYSWLLWTLAAVIQLTTEPISELIFRNFFVLLYGELTITSIAFLVLGLYSYIIEVPKVYYRIIMLIAIIPPMIFVFISTRIISIYYIILTVGLQTSIFLLPILGYNTFKKKIGKSKRWYYLMLMCSASQIIIEAIIQLSGIRYSLYENDNIPLLNLEYVVVAILSVITLILIIHIEYSLSTNDRRDLIDMYSHNLGNILQSLYSSHSLNYDENYANHNKKVLKKIDEEKLNEAAEIIQRIRKL